MAKSIFPHFSAHRFSFEIYRCLPWCSVVVHVLRPYDYVSHLSRGPISAHLVVAFISSLHHMPSIVCRLENDLNKENVRSGRARERESRKKWSMGDSEHDECVSVAHSRHRKNMLSSVVLLKAFIKLMVSVHEPTLEIIHRRIVSYLQSQSQIARPLNIVNRNYARIHTARTSGGDEGNRTSCYVHGTTETKLLK